MIGAVLFLFTELGIFFAAASEGIQLKKIESDSSMRTKS
jgi:hypothetical protein